MGQFSLVLIVRSCSCFIGVVAQFPALSVAALGHRRKTGQYRHDPTTRFSVPAAKEEALASLSLGTNEKE